MALPLHLLALAGASKNAERNLLLRSTTLCRLGLHPLRAAVAAACTGVRRRALHPMLPRALRRRFQRDGFVVIENALPPDLFVAVRDQAHDLDAPGWQCVQGDTITHRVLIDAGCATRAPALGALHRDRRLQHVLRYVAGRDAPPLLYVQRIRNGAVDAAAGDPQKWLHRDTFHPTLKAWLFLEPVSADQGPFTYVPGSHRLDRRTLRWMRWRSLRHARERDPYSRRGSWRITAAELRHLGLGPPVALAAPANTLVIADTAGIHARGRCDHAHERLEIWAYHRAAPFWPWPGLGADVLREPIHRLIERTLARRERRAAARGKRASWHRPPSTQP